MSMRSGYNRNTRSRVRQPRCVTACISWLLIALMTVGPERVYALSVEAQAHAAYAKAVAAGVLAQAVPGRFDWSYDYDDNGNLESTTKSDSAGSPVQADGYTYDGENRLATHSLGGALDVTYAYDADGIRTWSKKAGGDPTYFLTDKNRPYAQVIEERTWLDPADPDNPDPEDARLAVRYTYGDDLIAQDRVIDPETDPLATTRSYYHYDGQLSTRMLTDAQADPDTPSTAPPTVTDSYTYDAFGNLLDSTADDGTPTVNNYRYTGEQYDPNLGFYYLRARYYDQAVGRFTTRDTFAGNTFEPTSLHRYAYVANDPTNRLDPTGRFWWFIQGILAHWHIQSVYWRERGAGTPWTLAWGNLIERTIRNVDGRRRRTRLFRVDIIDEARDELYEIKPGNLLGIGAGIVQVAVYSLITHIPLGSSWPGGMRSEPFLGGSGTIQYWLAAPGVIAYRVTKPPPRRSYRWRVTRGRRLYPIWESPYFQYSAALALVFGIASIPAVVWGPQLLLAFGVVLANGRGRF